LTIEAEIVFSAVKIKSSKTIHSDFFKNSFLIPF